MSIRQGDRIIANKTVPSVYTAGSGISIENNIISAENTGGTVFTVTNPTLTATGGIATWLITNTIGKPAVIASIRETSTGNEVACDITYTASTITVKMNKTTNVPASVYTAVIIG